jgi:hypothetical protein
MRRIDPTGISVSADCSQARAGTQFVPLMPNVASTSNSPEIVSVIPPQIEISLVSASAPSSAHH